MLDSEITAKYYQSEGWRRLFEALDDARYIYHCDDMDLILVWHGGSIINIINELGEHIDCFSNDDITIYNVRRLCEEHMMEVENER